MQSKWFQVGGGRWRQTLAFKILISSGSMYGYLSWISRQMIRLSFRDARNREVNLVLCDCSMTKISSAHAKSSGVTWLSQSGLMPQEATAMPGQPVKISSAVGLLSLLRPQIKRTLFISFNGAFTRADIVSYRGSSFNNARSRFTTASAGPLVP